MAELEKGFPEELREVALDVTREYWRRMPEIKGRAEQFFHELAAQQFGSPLEPGETMDSRVATVLMLMFMMGREHAVRGYRPPIAKEVPPDEMPEDLEDAIERMLDHE